MEVPSVALLEATPRFGEAPARAEANVREYQRASADAEVRERGLHYLTVGARPEPSGGVYHSPLD